MTAVTVGLFILIVGGLGAAALSLAPARSWFWRLALSLPVGLGLLPPAFLLLRVLHVPLDWRVLGGMGLAGVVIALVDRRPAPPSEPQRAGAAAAAMVLALALTAVMYAGATRYPHLEDDDPWQHAVGARWVALQMTTAQPEPPITIVLEPYPPFYTALMGVLHQVGPDLKDILKFFNALLVGLSVLGAFFAFEALSGSSAKALAASALLAVNPSYMSHFIWAQTLAIPIFFSALWALATPAGSSSSGRFPARSSWLAGLLTWGATVTQASTAVVSGLLLSLAVLWWSAAARARGAPLPRAQVTAIAAGGVASLITWTAYMGPQLRIWAAHPQTFRGGHSADTSGGQVYGLRQIVFEYGDKIDQGTGLGWATAALAVIALIALIARWREDPPAHRTTRLVMATWLVIGLVGIEGNALPFKLFPHRFWVFLAIPTAYLAAEGAAALAGLASARWTSAGILVGAVSVAFGLNLGPRLALQRAVWPPGVGWLGPDHLGAWLQTAEHLPAWTKVFAPCFRDDYLIGLNLHAEPWDPALRAVRARLTTTTAAELAEVMRSRAFPYLVLDGACVQHIGLDATRVLDASIRASGRFRVEAQAPGFAVFQLLPP